VSLRLLLGEAPGGLGASAFALELAQPRGARGTFTVGAGLVQVITLAREASLDFELVKALGRGLAL
jgi:hypothetical protein